MQFEVNSPAQFGAIIAALQQTIANSVQALQSLQQQSQAAAKAVLDAQQQAAAIQPDTPPMTVNPNDAPPVTVNPPDAA